LPVPRGGNPDGDDNAAFRATVKGAPEAFIAIETRLKAMDAMAVDMEMLSINPFWYSKERDLAAEIVRIQNEKLAELCAAQPDRFAAFASLALQYPDLAVQQLETAVKKQGLRGAAIGGSVAGTDFADATFHPVWAKAEELGAVLFIHPQTPPELAKRLQGNGWLQNTIGLPTETTIALSHLIFEGTLDRFPGLKILAAHGGGYLPSYADRSDHACFVNPSGCDPIRCSGVHAGGLAPSRGAGRHQPDHARQRPPLPMGAAPRRRHHGDNQPQRRREDHDFGR